MYLSQGISCNFQLINFNSNSEWHNWTIWLDFSWRLVGDKFSAHRKKKTLIISQMSHCAESQQNYTKERESNSLSTVKLHLRACIWQRKFYWNSNSLSFCLSVSQCFWNYSLCLFIYGVNILNKKRICMCVVCVGKTNVKVKKRHVKLLVSEYAILLYFLYTSKTCKNTSLCVWVLVNVIVDLSDYFH